MSTIISGSGITTPQLDGVIINQSGVNVADNNELALKANITDLKELGVGQTWQDVTASRSAGVTYTNSTGKPIEVAITFNAGANKYIYVDSIIIGQINDDAGRSFFTFIVPAGSTYSMETGSVIDYWLELR